jgi:phage tail-like protein
MGNPGESSVANRKDPLPAYVFKISIDGLTTGSACAFFKSVGGIAYEVETVPLKEGGVNNTTWNLVGGFKWKNIVLKRGFTADSELLQWRTDWLNGTMVRHSGTITQLNSALQPVAIWSFSGGFPVKWEISEFDASKNEVAIETLEIAHNGLTYQKK